MSRNKNEQGYALVIVLFLIVFTMAVFAVFMRGAISNAKQEKIVDQNHLSVVAAEMGVDYYKTATINTFNIKKVDLMEQAQEQVHALVQSEAFLEMDQEQIKQSLETIRQGLIKSLENHLEEEVSKFHLPQPISSTIKFDNLSSPTVQALSNGVKVSGVITGHSEAYSKSLDFDITFNVPELNLGESGGGTGGNQGAIDMYHLYPDTSGVPVCTGNLTNKECIGDSSTPLNQLNGSIVYFPDGNSSANNNNIGFNNSRIYSNGHFIVKNMNKMTGVSLLGNGSFQANSNMNNMEKSDIIINGSMKVDGHLNPENNSTVLVRGALHVTKQLNVYESSKVCVDGSITVDGKLNLDSSSKVYVYGDIINNEHKNKVTIVENDKLKNGYKTETEFWNLCQFGNSTPSFNAPNWNYQPKVNVMY